MSRDKLEKFMADNREEFDEFMPDPALFEGVRIRKPKISLISRNSIIWKAAAVAAIFVASYFFHDWVDKPVMDQQLAVQGEETSEIVKMLIEAEVYYAAQIDFKKEEFYQLAADNQNIRSEIDYEMVELDSIYTDLRRDLKDDAANVEVIEAMIQNYRIKLDILENVLQQLRKAKSKDDKKDKSHEVEI